MNQRLEDDTLYISLDRNEFSELLQIRQLPFRRFNSDTKEWEVLHVRENLEEADRLGLRLEAPFTNATASTVGVKGRNLTVTVSGSPENVELCRRFPDTRKWDPDRGTWVVKPTRRNVDHLREAFPDIGWSQEAADLITKTEAPFVEKREDLDDLVRRATKGFDFKTEPYQHQLEVFALSKDARAFALFMEQGTGKTKSALDNAAYLWTKREITGLFIICPKSVKSTWVEQIEEHFPNWVERNLLVWQSGKTREHHVHALGSKEKKLAIFIMNIDAFSSGSGVKAAEAFLTIFRCMFVVDESSKIKNPQAKRTKACVKLGRHAAFRRILTGTPVTQAPLDLFTQFKFLDENILGFGSYYAFRNRYAILEDVRARGGQRSFQKVVSYVNLTELQDTIMPFSYRVTTAECLDLPDKVYRKLIVQLNQQQRKAYNSLVQDMEAEIEGIGSISVTMALTLMLRLQQVVGGFFPTNEEERKKGVTYKAIPGKSPKVDAILEDLEDEPGKVLIWARFRAEIDLMARSLRKSYGDDAVAEFHGSISEADRTTVRQSFQDPDSPLRFLVLQVDTGGVGLTFTAADKAYYLSNGFSLESRLQSEARNHRAGSEGHKRIVYTDVVAEDTLDPKVLHTLREKLSLANVITGDNWREWV
jgi:SNF2 family DNA or RNA helicase